MSITLPNPPDQPGTGFNETVEMAVQRQLTTAFIATQPIVIEMVPRTKVKQPGGGFIWQEQTARTAQTFRLVESSSSVPPRPVTGSNGQIRQMDFQLLGEWDAEIGRYDIFTLEDGEWWEVAELYHFNGWERRASVIKHG